MKKKIKIFLDDGNLITELLQHMVFVKMFPPAFYDYWNSLSAASGDAIFGQKRLDSVKNDAFAVEEMKIFFLLFAIRKKVLSRDGERR